MDAMAAKKLGTEIRTGTLILLLCAVLLSLIIFISRVNSNLNEEIDLAEAQKEKYRKTIGGDVDALIKAQESRRHNLEQYYNELKKSLNKSKSESADILSPLSFKKLLFDTRERLASKAKHNNVSLPQDLGFEDYKLKLPEAALIPVLTDELTFSERIIMLLIKNKIYALKSMELPHKVESLGNNTQSAAGVSFQSISMRLSVESEFKQLKSFLLDLAGSERNYVVGQIIIKRADETSGRLLADINIKNLQL